MDPVVCVCGKKVSARLARCPYCKEAIAPSPSLVAAPLPPLPIAAATATYEPSTDAPASTASTLVRLGAGALLMLGLGLIGLGCWRASVPTTTPAGELGLGSPLSGSLRVEGATLEWDNKMYLITGKDGRQFSSKSPHEGVDKISYREFLARASSYLGKWVHIDGSPPASVAVKSVWVRYGRGTTVASGTREDRPSPILCALSDDVWVASDDVMSLNAPQTKDFMNQGSYQGRVQRLREIASSVSAGWDQLGTKYRELSKHQLPSDAVVILTGRPYEGKVTATYVPILESTGRIWVQFDGEVAPENAPPIVGAPLDVLPPERSNAPELEAMKDVIAVGKAAGPLARMRGFGGTGALGILFALVGAIALVVTRRR